MAFWDKGNKFPYTNNHDANLDYMMTIFENIKNEWHDLYVDLVEWKGTTTLELNTWKTNALAQIEQYETDFRAEIAVWKATTEQDIGVWEQSVLADLGTWRANFETLFATTFSNLSQIKTDAEAARDAAAESAEAAKDSADEAAASAESVSSALTQIATNTGDISDLKTQLEAISDTILVPITENTEGLTYAPGCYASAAGLVENPNFNTWYFDVTQDTDFWFADDVTADYLSITIFNGNLGHYVGRYRLQEGNLPTEENPFSAVNGYIIAVSIMTTDLGFILYSSNSKRYVLDSTLGLTAQMEDEIEEILPAQPLKKKVYYNGADKYFMFYLPTSNRQYIGIKFVYSNAAFNNCHVWRLDTMSLYDEELNEIISSPLISTSQEWECAIKYEGATDFIGGRAHGDEQIINITVIIDSIVIDLTSTDSFTKTFDNISIFRNSTLNKQDDTSDIFAKHMVIYTINDEGIEIEQRIEFLSDLNMVQSYLCMFPICRRLGEINTSTYGDELPYVTTAGFKDTDNYLEQLLINHQNFTYTQNVKEIQIFNNTDSGYRFFAKVGIKDANNSGGCAAISNAPQYNKIYYDFTDYSFTSTPTAVHTGDEWKQTSFYKFDYNGFVS